MMKTLTAVNRILASKPQNGEPAELRMLRLYYRQIRECDEALTSAGVPEWVDLVENNGVPCNTVPCRLKWYLARRKEVKPSEADLACQLNAELQDMDQ